jgi:polysaccharide pyruvyl transferase WcaK-like protein
MTREIVIWGAWYGSRNVGDQLLLLAITDILQKRLPQSIYFTVLTDDAAWIKKYTSAESVCNITAIQSRQKIIDVIITLKNCDLFIFGGGVPFFEKQSHVLVMLFLVSIIRLFRKPYLLWSVSSQTVESKFALLAFRWILNGTNMITYRDTATKNLFESCGIKPDCMHQVADPGFTLESNDPSSGIEILKKNGWSPDGRPLAALTPRSLRTADGEAETHYTIQSTKQYQQKIDCFVAAYDWLWENGYQPVFIPMNTIPPDDDRIAAKDIIAQARYGEYAILVKDALRPRIVSTLYQQCQVSFVARVHGSITSMLGNCPMMMYAFAPKHMGIMELMKMEEYCLQSRWANPANTIKILEKLTTNCLDLQQRMEMRLRDLQEDAIFPVKLIEEKFQNK